MAIPDDLVEQLEKVIRSLHDIGIPRDELRWTMDGLVKSVYSVRTGRKPKLDKQIVFDALTTWRNDVHARDGRWPRQFQMALFIVDTFGCSREQAKKLARTYRLWYLKGYAQLTKADRAHLEKNFSREWRESEKTSKLVAKVFADIRKALAEHAKHIEQSTRNLPKPKGRRGKLIESKDEIFRLLDQS